MKILTTTILFVALGLNTKAQIVTSTNMPSIGDTAIYSLGLQSSTNLGSLGSGNNWDFSRLSDIDSDTILFLSPSVNPISTNFPSSNIGGLYDQEMEFYDLNSNNLQSLGISYSTEFIKFNKPLSIINFPSQLGTTFKDTASYILIYDPGSSIVDSIKANYTLDIESKIDASGTITTPLGTFNAIRQVVREIYTDTSFYKISGTWDTTPGYIDSDTTYTHYYWSSSNSVRYPLVQYKVDKNGVLDPALYIDWLKLYLLNPFAGIQEIEKKPISLYPNPVLNSLSIKVENDFKNIQIIDLTGKTVIYSTENSKQIDVSNLVPGVYIVKVSGENFTGTSRFVKE